LVYIQIKHLLLVSPEMVLMVVLRFVAVLFRIPNIFRVAGGSGYITKIRFGVNSATWTDQCKIHFYGSAAISSFDNTTFILWWANESVRLGYSLLPALSTEGAGGDLSVALGAPGDGTSELPCL